MSKRIRRKSISNTFKIKGRVCKVILKPLSELDNGFWVWNVGFAVGKSNRQINDWFKVYQYWKRYHCDWLYDKEKLEFYWTRPPYPDDTIWKKGEIIGVTPKKPLEPIHPGAYFDCFTFLPYDN
jgi:hypothetical protein